MAKNSQNTTTNVKDEVTEQREASKRKREAGSTTTRAVRSFVHESLTNPSTGVDFFNRVMGASSDDKKKAIVANFQASISGNRELDEQSDELKQALENVTFLQIRNVTIALDVGYESRRATTERIINNRYRFSSAEQKKIRNEIQNLSVIELDGVVKNEAKRVKFLKRTLPGKTFTDIEKDREEYSEQIEKAFGGKHLTDEQRKAGVELLTRESVHPHAVRSFIHLFPSLEEKQLLIQLLLPQTSLSDLEDAGVLSHHQVQTALRKSLTEAHAFKKYRDSSVDIEEMVYLMDPSEIMIDTALFPDDIVDVILGSAGADYIAETIGEGNKEMYAEYEKQNNILIKAEKGKFLPGFQKILTGLGIENPKDFVEGSYIAGETKDKNGEERKFVYRIDMIVDDPSKNGNIYDASKCIALTQVLLGDGSWRTHAPKNTSPDASYGDMRDFFELAKKNGKIELTSAPEVEKEVHSGKTKESIREHIETIADLNHALDQINPAWKAYPLKAEGGVCIAMGEPGDKDYWVYEITSVNEWKRTIELHNGSTSEIIDFDSFLEGFKANADKNTRLPGVRGMGSLLHALQTTAPNAKAFEGLSFEDGKILMQNRKDEKDFPGITEFIGKNGAIRIESMDNPKMVTFVHYPDYEEGSDGEKKYKKGLKYTVGYNALYKFLAEGKSTPSAPEKSKDGPEQEHAHPHMHTGWFKSYLGNYSIHDMLKGATDAIGFLKEHLHHGSSLNAAKFQLAIGKKMKWLGMDEGILREMRAKVYSNNKKLMTELIDTIKGLASAERFIEVEHILCNEWSHDYEIQAATIAMLQKHGTLYAGNMRKYQGTFFFFERLSGMKYSPNLPIVQKCMKICAENGEPFREEILIQDYLRWLGSGEAWYQIDGNLWLEVKKGWGSGMKDEAESGERETGQKHTLTGRTKYVMKKLKEGEFAHGLGGIKAIWDKGFDNGPHEMHLPAIALALSNIPDSLHQEQLKTLRNHFLGGRPYTALLFLRSPAEQQVFRNVIKKLSTSDPGMKAAYSKVEHLQQHDDGEDGLFNAITNFWGTYGAQLEAKLNIARDPEIFNRKDSDPDFKQYYDTCSAFFGGWDNLDKDEKENGAYAHEASWFFAFNPENYLKRFVKINAGQAVLEGNDKTTEDFWKSATRSVDAIRTMSISGTPGEVRDKKFSLYKHYHRAFMTYFNANKFSAEAYEKLRAQDFIQQLEAHQWIKLTPYGTDYLTTPSYEQSMEEDFDRFMQGEQTVKTEKIKVLDSVHDTLAANDSRFTQAA